MILAKLEEIPEVVNVLPLLQDEYGEEVVVPVEVVGHGRAQGVHEEVPGQVLFFFFFQCRKINAHQVWNFFFIQYARFKNFIWPVELV